jgi:hypothetical protein
MTRALSGVWILLFSLLAACGDCPDARHVPAQAAYDHAEVFTIAGDGSVTREVVGRSVEVSCDAGCQSVVLSQTASCGTMCEQLLGSPASECTFLTDRSHLRCTQHHDAQEERCNCSFIDC